MQLVKPFKTFELSFETSPSADVHAAAINVMGAGGHALLFEPYGNDNDALAGSAFRWRAVQPTHFRVKSGAGPAAIDTASAGVAAR